MNKKIDIIEDLSELKEELWADRFDKETIEQYNEIIDYIGTSSSYWYNVLNNTRQESINVVFNQDVESLLQKEATSVSRIKIFVNSTIEDEIYQLDGYGNLKNITTDDLDTLILNLIQAVEED